MAPTYIEASFHSQHAHLHHLQLHCQRLQAIKNRPVELKRTVSEPRVRSSTNTAAHIAEGNRLLMLKLLAIDRRKQSDFCTGSELSRSLNEVVRRRTNNEIAEANAKLALRLIHTPCKVPHRLLAQQYQATLKYKQLGSHMLQLHRVSKTLSSRSVLVKHRAKSLLRLRRQDSVKL